MPCITLEFGPVDTEQKHRRAGEVTEAAGRISGISKEGFLSARFQVVMDRFRVTRDDCANTP